MTTFLYTYKFTNDLKRHLRFHFESHPSFMCPASSTAGIEPPTHSHSLIEQVVPVGPDKVPGQRLTQGVPRDGVDHGCGVLLADSLRVQTVLQVPGGQGGQGSS